MKSILNLNGGLWVCFLGVLMFFSPSIVVGNEISPGDNPVNSLQNYHASGKIGGNNDNNKFAQSVWKYLNKKEQGADIIERAQSILKIIKTETKKIWDDIPDDSVENQIKLVVRHLEIIIKKNTPNNTPNKWTDEDIAIAVDALVRDTRRIDDWKIDSDDLSWAPIAEVHINFNTDFLENNCESPTSLECMKSFKEAVEALRIAELTYRTAALLKTTKINDASSFFKKRIKQREEYQNGFPQWLWEELINGQIYKTSTRDIPGSPQPPTSQLIVMHPDIVVEYMPDAKDGDQFKPAFMVELVGINYWEWEKDGSMGGPFFGLPVGVSFITTFTDREDQTDWGWGGILHINHIFNLGATFRDGDPGYFISLNLATLFNSSKETVGNVLGN
jgi:hypothetical protein